MPALPPQRAQLCFYDEEGTGELGGPQLERYLADGRSKRAPQRSGKTAAPSPFCRPGRGWLHIWHIRWRVTRGRRGSALETKGLASESPSAVAALPTRAPAVAQELPLLASMEPWFLPHYTRITARKLLFFHGKRKCRGGEMRVRRAARPRWGSTPVRGRPSAGARSARMPASARAWALDFAPATLHSTRFTHFQPRLSDLMVSPVMMELQELRALGLAAGAGGAPPDDRDLSSNWFSLQVRRGDSS